MILYLSILSYMEFIVLCIQCYNRKTANVITVYFGDQLSIDLTVSELLSPKLQISVNLVTCKVCSGISLQETSLSPRWAYISLTVCCHHSSTFRKRLHFSLTQCHDWNWLGNPTQPSCSPLLRSSFAPPSSTSCSCSSICLFKLQIVLQRTVTTSAFSPCSLH
jgi:hypothetical protein